MESRLASLLPEPRRLRDTEFKVFSQWGEEGILQILVSRLSPRDAFVEIGVGDYSEANTRFLARKDNWRGAIFNGGSAHIYWCGGRSRPCDGYRRLPIFVKVP